MSTNNEAKNQTVPANIQAKIEARELEQKREKKARKYSREFRLVKPAAEVLKGVSTPQQVAVVKAITAAASKVKTEWVSSDQVLDELMDVESAGFLTFKTRINLKEEYGKPSHKAACIQILAYYENPRFKDGNYDVR